METKICRFNEKTLYSELKEFFELTDLPERLITENYEFPYLKFTVKTLIETIDTTILKQGKPDQHAKYCKQKLIEIANAL